MKTTISALFLFAILALPITVSAFENSELQLLEDLTNELIQRNGDHLYRAKGISALIEHQSERVDIGLYASKEIKEFSHDFAELILKNKNSIPKDIDLSHRIKIRIWEYWNSKIVEHADTSIYNRRNHDVRREMLTTNSLEENTDDGYQLPAQSETGLLMNRLEVKPSRNRNARYSRTLPKTMTFSPLKYKVRAISRSETVKFDVEEEENIKIILFSSEATKLSNGWYSHKAQLGFKYSGSAPRLLDRKMTLIVRNTSTNEIEKSAPTVLMYAKRRQQEKEFWDHRTVKETTDHRTGKKRKRVVSKNRATKTNPKKRRKLSNDKR